MYALASLGLRCSAAGFCVAGAALGALQGVRCTPWRPLVSAALPVAFARQAQHLVPPQGVGCTPWRPLVSGALPVAFAWQAQHLVLCKGSAVRPGVPWSPLLCRWLLRGRRSTWCSARGPMYALASLGLRCSAGGFCVAGAALGALQGVRCTPWCPLVSAGSCVAGAALGALQGVRCTPWRLLVSAALPVAFAWQARHLVLCKGSDVRPGVPWSPLLCRWLLHGRGGTHSVTHSLTYSIPLLTPSLTPSLPHSLTHCTWTYIHRSITLLPDVAISNSPTITAPSLLYFLFPSCFSMLSLSLKKLVTCGVIRSFNFWCFPIFCKVFAYESKSRMDSPARQAVCRRRASASKKSWRPQKVTSRIRKRCWAETLFCWKRPDIGRSPGWRSVRFPFRSRLKSSECQGHYDDDGWYGHITWWKCL